MDDQIMVRCMFSKWEREISRPFERDSLSREEETPGVSSSLKGESFLEHLKSIARRFSTTITFSSIGKGGNI